MKPWKPPVQDSRTKRVSSRPVTSKLETELRSHVLTNQVRRQNVSFEAKDGRSACSCEACQGLLSSGMRSLGSSSDFDVGTEARSGCSSSSSLFVEENEHFEGENLSTAEIGTDEQTRQRRSCCPEFGYGVFRCIQRETFESCLNDGNTEPTQWSVQRTTKFPQKRPDCSQNRYAAETESPETFGSSLSGECSRSTRLNEPWESIRLSARGASLSAPKEHMAAAYLDSLRRNQVEASTAARTYAASRDFSFSICMSDSSQPPFTEQPKGDGVLMGRLWSVASLGVNEPNEDHWQVESDRLFHDYASVDLDARLSRMLHTDAQVDYPEAGIVWGLQEPKSGSKKITETASDQMERLQDRSDTWCDSDSDDSFTVCILDGHEGSTCCELLQNLLLKSIRERCSSNGRHTELLRAIGPSGFCERLAETFEHVDRQLLEHLWQKLEETGDGHYAITGACCVTATLTNGGNDLFVASLGDCEAYLGRRGLVSDEDSPDKESSVTSSSRQRMEAMQLCYSHNLRIESNMKCLQDQFPGDPSVVQKIGNNYFVKGKLQVSHAFGNGYLKEERFNEKLYPIFRAKPPFCGRYVSSKPQVRHISLTERDEFLILATDGFWEHVDPRSAVALIGHFFAPDSAQIDKKDADTIDPRRACELLMQYLWLRLHCSESIEADSADEVLQRKQRGKRGGRLRDDTSVLVLFLHPTELPNRDAANSYTGSLDYVDWCEKQDDDSASRARILRGMVSAWLNASE